jgi:hypothetical protein
MAISQLWQVTYHFEKSNVRTSHTPSTAHVVAAGKTVSFGDGHTETFADEAAIKTVLANNSVSIPAGAVLVLDRVSEQQSGLMT